MGNVWQDMADGVECKAIACYEEVLTVSTKQANPATGPW